MTSTDVLYGQVRNHLQTYFPLSNSTWTRLCSLLKHCKLKAKQHYVHLGEYPKDFAYLASGLMRAYALDAEGHEYTKIFFEENSMPGSMVALLTGSQSKIGIDALEDSSLVLIDFAGYRELLMQSSDLLLNHVHYLEHHWVIDKEQREIALAQQTATERYVTFCQEHPGLVNRISQRLMASHLGITPTQLSRIRRSLDNST